MELLSCNIQGHDASTLPCFQNSIIGIVKLYDQCLKSKINIHRVVNSSLGAPMVMFITKFYLFWVWIITYFCQPRYQSKRSWYLLFAPKRNGFAGPVSASLSRVTQLLLKKCCGGGEPLATQYPIWPAVIGNFLWSVITKNCSVKRFVRSKNSQTLWQKQASMWNNNSRRHQPHSMGLLFQH